MLMKAYEAKKLVERELLFRELEDVEHELSKAISDCKDTFLVPFKLSEKTISKLEDLGYTVYTRAEGNFVSFADACEGCDISRLFKGKSELSNEEDTLNATD